MSNADASFEVLHASTSDLIFGHVVGSDTVAITLDLDRIADGSQLGAWAHNLAVPIAKGGRRAAPGTKLADRVRGPDPRPGPDHGRGGGSVPLHG